MYSKQRQLPLEVFRWMEKDISISKLTTSSRLTPNDTRQNFLLRRQFFSNILNLSVERYRKITRSDYDKKTFLKIQQHKAQTSMPGLLPYVEQLTPDTNSPSRLTSNRNDRFLSSSMQSFSSRLNIKSASSLNRRHQSAQKNKTPQPRKSIPISTKASERQERINRLAQPKGYRPNSTTNNHLRSNIVREITVEDLFSNVDEPSNRNSALTDKPKSAKDDKRFHQLVHIFSAVHEREAPNLSTVQSIVECNTSLQGDESPWHSANAPISRKNELKNHLQTLNEQFFRKTDMFLIDVGA